MTNTAGNTTPRRGISIPGLRSVARPRPLLVLLWMLASGCDPASSNPCRVSTDCALAETCIDGRCRVRPDSGPAPDAGPTDDAAYCSAARTCGEACCETGQTCAAGDVCCIAADLCGGVCCVGSGRQCVADVCVLDCGDAAPCGDGTDAVCCGGAEVCLLGECTSPGAACDDPFDCPALSYCEASIGRCLPRVTDLPACEYRPTPEPFELEVEWHWENDPDVMPLHDQVMSTAMVANLTDDDGDGDIDQDDVPDVVFNTFRTRSPDTGGASAYAADGVLRAISGDDGHRLWPTTTPAYRTNPAFEVAIADLRADSAGPEIVGCTFDPGTTYGTGRLTIFAATGAILFRFDGGVSVPCGRPAVADMNGDGVAEIAVGNRITQADGSGSVVASITGSAIAALYDVDGDPDLELVGIDGVADHDGTVVWRAPLWTGETGYVAVADMDLDGDPDIVATSTVSHQVTVRDGRTGALVAGPVEVTPTGDPAIDARVAAVRAARPGDDPLTGGGPPTIANFDEDPHPEFALAGGYAYVVFEHDATLAWYRASEDTSSRATGSSVFDFEGDGRAEVLYNDEYRFRAFRGASGDTYVDRCNTSGTLAEYPIVVDVDNDDHAEIVLVENNYSRTTCADGSRSSTGVWSFGHPRGRWVRTRRIWNQHTYHVTNIEEDGTLPLREVANHATPGLNNFRQNVQPVGLFDAPDLVLRDVTVSTRDCSAALRFRARVVNEGRAGAPAGVPISVYVGGEFATLLRTTRALLPGASEIVELRFGPIAADTAYEFTALLDDPLHDPLPALNECRTDNNASAPAVGACPEVM